MIRTRMMRDWALWTVNGRGPYVAGRDVFGTLRTSTAVVAYDPVRQRCETASGAIYRLDEDGENRVAAKIAIGTHFVVGDDVTIGFVDPADVVAVIERNGNASRVSPEERAALVAQRTEVFVREIADGLAMADRLHGVSVEDIAQGSHLSADVIVRIASGERPEGVTDDDVEDVNRLVWEVVKSGVAPAAGTKP